MRLPSTSVILTINERPPDVLGRVFRSLAGQAADELVVVFDRTPLTLRDQVVFMTSLMRKKPVFVEIAGDPGWLCPAKAWNAGFGAATMEVFYCLSSEVIQAPDNILNARRLLCGPPAVVFGKAVDTGEEPLTTSATDPQVLCSSEIPRPLGFMVAMPAWCVRSVGGYDEAFMKGYWYDDDDFFYRLWRLGIPFVYDDNIFGQHQAHPRPVLKTDAGKDGIRRNLQLMIAKWGAEHPINGEPMGYVNQKEKGRLVWFPKAEPGMSEAQMLAWDLPQRLAGPPPPTEKVS